SLKPVAGAPSQPVSGADHSDSPVTAFLSGAAAVAERSITSELADETSSFFSESVGPAALDGLSQLAERAAGPLAIFGMLLVPSHEKSSLVEGAIPDRADLKYD